MVPNIHKGFIYTKIKEYLYLYLPSLVTLTNKDVN